MEKKLEAHNKTLSENTKKQTEKQKAEELQNNFVASLSAAKVKYKDYLDAVADLDIPVNSELGQNIMECGEMGSEIMYFLGKNPDEEARLLQLSGSTLARAIGKLEAKLATPIKKKTTQAPDPITPTRSNKPTGSKVNLKEASDMDFYNEFNRKMYG